MPQPDDTSLIKNSLPNAKTIFIVLSQNPNYDGVAASLALYLSLKKAGKQVTIASSQEITVEFSSLVGVDKIKNKLGGRNLNIYLDERVVEKVSYNLEGGKLNLVIRPKEGFTILPPEKLEYAYSGGEADLIFILGSDKPEDLGSLYKENKALFDQEEKICRLGQGGGACFTEQIASLISRWGLPIDVDIATNLIKGMEKATNNFSSALASAETFGAMAFCLRAGGRRETGKRHPLELMPTEVSNTKAPDETPPSDWLQPKIYKGNVRV